MEYNSHEKFTSLIIPPSYLVDLQILPKFIKFKNPLRHSSGGDEIESGDGSLKLDIKYNGIQNNDQSWFESVFYSIVNNFVDGRSGLYDSQETRKVMFVDKKQNRLLIYEPEANQISEGEWTDKASNCNENNFRAINDTLFEFKTSSSLDVSLIFNITFLLTAPNWDYLHIENGKLVALPNRRIFGFTKYVKMDDSYLSGCFTTADIASDGKETEEKKFDRMTPDLLEYMKNEIYASYGYKFKDAHWNELFSYRFRDVGTNANVNDSLTVIDKYNINWINQKLYGVKATPNTLAAK